MSIFLGGKAISLSDFHGQLRTLDAVREQAPSALGQLVSLAFKDEIHLDEVIKIINCLPHCCKPNEVHTMAVDMWTELWVEPHRCCHEESELPSYCVLSHMRSVIAGIIIEVLVYSKKGPLFRYRGNHMLTMAGQLLCRVWVPETRKRVHLHLQQMLQWIEVTNKAVDYFFLPEESKDATRQMVNVEAGVRLVVAMVDWFSRSGLEELEKTAVIEKIYGPLFFPLAQRFLETKYTSIVMRHSLEKHALPNGTPIAERPIDLELFDNDIALLVCVAEKYQLVNPSLLPLVWSAEWRSQVCLAARSVLRIMGDV